MGAYTAIARFGCRAMAIAFYESHNAAHDMRGVSRNGCYKQHAYGEIELYIYIYLIESASNGKPAFYGQ